MEPELEGGDNAKVPAPAPYTPEQVCVLIGTYFEDSALGGDEIDGDQIVARKPVLMRQPADTTTECESCHAGMGDNARRGSQAEGLCRTVEVS